MGGPYPELYCAICDKIITDKAPIVHTLEGAYNEFDEVIEYEPYIDGIYHKECFKRRWQIEPNEMNAPI